MVPDEVDRGVAAALSIAARLGLAADDAVMVNQSNKLTVHLLPCDAIARVALGGADELAFETDVARQLAATGAPVAAIDPRVEPRVHAHDGFAVTLWTRFEPMPIAPAEYAGALVQLHAAMRTLDVPTPHFTDRVDEAERHVVAATGVDDADRALVLDALRVLRDRPITAEQVLHGEPHPGNVLGTVGGPRFIDFETCCRGPVEFDLAHVPDAVSHEYPGVDRDLLGDCRRLVLAMVVGWRWEPGDQLPNGEAFARELLAALRAGPPGPTIDVVYLRAIG